MKSFKRRRVSPEARAFQQQGSRGGKPGGEKEVTNENKTRNNLRRRDRIQFSPQD